MAMLIDGTCFCWPFETMRLFSPAVVEELSGLDEAEAHKK
jgi:hypothetical protein